MSAIVVVLCVLVFPWLDMPVIIQILVTAGLGASTYFLLGQHAPSIEAKRDTFLLIVAAIAVSALITILLVWAGR